MTNPHDRRYQNPEYWGEEPTTIARRLFDFLPSLKVTFPNDTLQVLDIGGGDGRDAIYLARNGIEVTALDSSPVGIGALRQKAEREELGPSIRCVQADLLFHKPDREYHAIISSGAFHYAPPESRRDLFERYKRRVIKEGIFACTVIVQKPFIPPAPDAEEGVSLFRTGEIALYFWDWEILWSVEEIKDCNSSGVPHRHAFNRIIARKTTNYITCQ